MSAASADRRILRAFYTQYVAVLLIILTFTVGAFQRTTSVVSAGPGTIAPGLVAQRSILSLRTDELFSDEGAVVDRDGRMRAIAEVLKNHDINLKATLVLRRFEVEESSPSLRRAILRAESIERFFDNLDVPAGVVSIRIERGRDLNESAQFELLDVERTL